MPGIDNSKVTVHTFDIKSRVTRKMDLPLDIDGYIPRIKFTDNPEALAIMTLNRHQNRFDLYLANPRSTLCKLIIRDEAEQYIKETAYANIQFYPNHIVMMSERDGFNHLYLYTAGGNLVKQITQGKYEVKDFLGWDEKNNVFYYESNEESPLRSAIYKIDNKGKKTKLSTREGTNNAIFSKNQKYYINTFSNITTPPVITLNDNTGKVLTTLVDNKALVKKVASLNMPSKELFTFTTTDGVELNGWMMKPINFDANKKYPVILHQYSGPGSQEVLDTWRIGARNDGGMFEAYMASQGFIMVCVDGRGTGGRGTEFGKCTYLKIGQYEPADQVEAAKYMASLPYVDAKNIGIWGWSFGGYNTLMSMSQPEAVFKAGVAVAAPSDWRFYDTVYTERYMRTPKENKEGYDKGSAVVNAANLNGPLLLVHGTADDNRCRRVEKAFLPDNGFNLHDFFFFGFDYFVNLSDMSISGFLHVGFIAFQIVFGNFACFLGFFAFFQNVAAFVAHRYFEIFAHFGNVFSQLFAAVFGHGRQGDADYFTVVNRAGTEIGFLKGFVDIV